MHLLVRSGCTALQINGFLLFNLFESVYWPSERAHTPTGPGASELFLLSLKAPAPVAQSHLIVWVICNSNQGGTTWQSGRARFQPTQRLSHLSLSTSLSLSFSLSLEPFVSVRTYKPPCPQLRGLGWTCTDKRQPISGLVGHLCPIAISQMDLRPDELWWVWRWGKPAEKLIYLAQS